MVKHLLDNHKKQFIRIGLQPEDTSFFKHAGLMVIAGVLGDFFHDDLLAPGFEMGDIDFHRPPELCQFICQQLGGKMPGRHGNAMFILRESGFDDDGPQVFDAVYPIP